MAAGMVVAVALLTTLVLTLWSAREAAVRDCVLASPEGQRIPSVAGETTLRVDIIDLIVYRKVETSYAGEQDEAVQQRIDACVADPG